ncbi:MAG: FMN-binding protein [Desulfobacterales bacterium]|nr:FMN-binding protein [Desulfobacterales bacterium]
MFKRMSTTAILLVGLSLIIAAGSFAFTVLTREDAMKQVFFPGAVIETETKELDAATLEKVKGQLGGALVFHGEGSEAKGDEASNKIEFIFAKKDGKRLGVAIIDSQPGKWGPVIFITTMNVQGVIKSVKVMEYSEVRGRPIARSSFLNQFNGKTVNSTLEVGKDIVGISGATISSQAAVFSVKKCLALYSAVYLTK